MNLTHFFALPTGDELRMAAFFAVVAVPIYFGTRLVCTAMRWYLHLWE